MRLISFLSSSSLLKNKLFRADKVSIDYIVAITSKNGYLEKIENVGKKKRMFMMYAMLYHIAHCSIFEGCVCKDIDRR